jgi:hypothetical protein
MQNTEAKKEEQKAKDENTPSKSKSFTIDLLDWADLYSDEEEPEEEEEQHVSPPILNPAPVQEANTNPSQEQEEN